MIKRNVLDRINDCKDELELKKIQCTLLYFIEQELAEIASKRLIYK